MGLSLPRLYLPPFNVKTDPPRWYDTPANIVAAVTTEWWSGKVTHDWTWEEGIPDEWLLTYPLSLEADPQARNRDTSPWAMFMATNADNCKVAIIRPVNYRLAFHVGFVRPDTGQRQYNRVIHTGILGYQLAHFSVNLHAWALPDNEPIELRVVNVVTRRTLPDGVRIL